MLVWGLGAIPGAYLASPLALPELEMEKPERQLLHALKTRVYCGANAGPNDSNCGYWPHSVTVGNFV